MRVSVRVRIGELALAGVAGVAGEAGEAADAAVAAVAMDMIDVRWFSIAEEQSAIGSLIAVVVIYLLSV